MIVYISIGNSDDKLSQRQWSGFVASVERTLTVATAISGYAIHGSWRSSPDAPYQNACWCIELGQESSAAPLRADLRRLASDWRQDSIAWAEVPVTEFLGVGNA